MRRDINIGQMPKRAVLGQWFIFKYVEHRATDNTVAQCTKQVIFIDDAAPAHVYQHGG